MPICATQRWYAPQKLGLVLSVVGPHTELCGAYANMRHRKPTLCGACWHMRHRIPFTHVQYRTPHGPHNVSVAHHSKCATESNNYVAHHCFMRHSGPYLLTRHKNIFVEHAFLGASENTFLPIRVFLVVRGLRFSRHLSCCLPWIPS
jgi:hypothetical protein